MQIFPAIDLSGGQVVRLYQGDYDKMTVYGADPCAAARDFIDAGAKYLHVVDLAVGHLKALEYAKNANGVEAINLGTGNGISVLDLVNAFNTANNMQLPYVIGPRREGDLPAFWADAAKAKELLGWEATHTVEDMCCSAWNFAKNASKIQ